MDLLEESGCNNRIKDDTKINIYPIYTVAFTVSEIHNKSSINVETNEVEFPGKTSASSTTLKNDESFEICKSIIDDTIDIKMNLNIDSAKQSNNNISVSETSMSNALQYIKKPLKIQNRATLSTKSKLKKCTRLVKIKNIHFKNKQPKNNLNKKLESYYDQAKSKSTNTGTIQKNLYSDSILNAVSRTRVLKKALAKENLLDDMEKISLNENYNDDRISYMSQSSDITLTRERSISSNNSTFYSTKTTPSVIYVSNNSPRINQDAEDFVAEDSTVKKNTSTSIHSITETYKKDNNIYNTSTNIIRVAVAQIENSSVLKYKQEITAKNSRDQFPVKDSLISSGSYLSQSDTIPSTSSLETSNNNENAGHITTVGMSDSGVSSETLTDNRNAFDLTSESDQFVSYFRDKNNLSIETLKPVQEINVKNEQNQQKSSPKLLKSSLLDTIINVGMFPKVTKSIQNNVYSSKFNDVIITDELRNSFPLNRFSIESSCENKYPNTVFKKSLNPEDDENRQKSINIPNEETINEILFNRNQAQKKTCSEESRNYTVFPELWEKLRIFIDMSIKRLEDSLVNKITQELKKAIDEFSQNSCRREVNSSRSDIVIRKKSQETVVVSRMALGETKSLQCGSLKSHVLDELVKKINLEGLKVIKNPKSKLEDKYKYISSDFFEVLKAPVEPCVSVEKGNRHSIDVSSSENVTIKSSTQHVPDFVKNVIRFAKENSVVIISVPVFCFALFLIYVVLSVLLNA